MGPGLRRGLRNSRIAGSARIASSEHAAGVAVRREPHRRAGRRPAARPPPFPDRAGRWRRPRASRRPISSASRACSSRRRALLLGEAVAVAGERGEPILRLAVASVARPPRRPCAPGPIAEIGPGSASKRDCAGSPRPGGHGWRSRRREGRPPRSSPGQLVERGALVRVGGHQLALGGEGGEARAGLDGELVEREVAGAEGERPSELCRPVRPRSGPAARR
jgi:hypothetical protein